jgi:putative NIF3 family GTP cyclohydrolase 1 type 2
MPRLGDVIALLEERYDPSTAESWDAVGLVCGDRDDDVRRVHFAVDPVAAVVDEVIAAGAQLLVTHHPLFLGGTTSVAADTAKGRVVHRLISNGVALYVAHTNADVADPGVSDALAAAIGLTDVRPLQSPSSGLGRIGEVPQQLTLAEFAGLVAQSLPATAWGVRLRGTRRRRSAPSLSAAARAATWPPPLARQAPTCSSHPTSSITRPRRRSRMAAPRSSTRPIGRPSGHGWPRRPQ